MQAQLFSDAATPVALRCRRAPRHLVLLVERLAGSASLCTPELCAKFSGGRTIVATALTYQEAVAMEAHLRAVLSETLRERDAKYRTLHLCWGCRRHKDAADVALCPACVAKLPEPMREALAEMTTERDRARWERDALKMLRALG